MLPGVRNFLYRNPGLYDAVYHGSKHDVPVMCERIATQLMGRTPESLLDVGCGTGRDLAYFAGAIPDCVGVDLQEQMVDFARQRYPHIDFRAGDVRTFRLGRTFDLITSLGWVIGYLHTNEEIDDAFATFAAHAHPGSVLVVEIINSIADSSGCSLPAEFAVDTPELSAQAVATYGVDRRHQLLSRRRLWTFSDGSTEEDSVRWRMLFPMEVERHMSAHGFVLEEVFDNTEMRSTELSGTQLFLVARRRG